MASPHFQIRPGATANGAHVTCAVVRSRHGQRRLGKFVRQFSIDQRLCWHCSNHTNEDADLPFLVETVNCDADCRHHDHQRWNNYGDPDVTDSDVVARWRFTVAVLTTRTCRSWRTSAQNIHRRTAWPVMLTYVQCTVTLVASLAVTRNTQILLVCWMYHTHCRQQKFQQLWTQCSWHFDSLLRFWISAFLHFNTKTSGNCIS